MIERTDIFNINFYKKERFHGSYKGMHYRIEKYEPDKTSRKSIWKSVLSLFDGYIN